MIPSLEPILSLPEIAGTFQHKPTALFHQNQTRGSRCCSKLHTCAQIKISPHSHFPCASNTTKPASDLPKPSTGSYSQLSRLVKRGQDESLWGRGRKVVRKEWVTTLGSYSVAFGREPINGNSALTLPPPLASQVLWNMFSQRDD